MRNDQSGPKIEVGGAKAEGAQVSVNVGQQPPAVTPPRSGSKDLTWKTILTLIAATGIGASGTTYAVHNAVSPSAEIGDTMAQIARDISDLKRVLNDRDLARIAHDADVGGRFTSLEGKVDTLAAKVEDLRIEIASSRRGR